MFKYKLPDNTHVHDHECFSHCGVNYPANWLSDKTKAELKALNIQKVEFPDPVVITPKTPQVYVEPVKILNTLLTNFQFKAALVQYGIFKDFNSLIVSMPEDSIVYLKWMYSSIEKSSGLVELLKTNFNISPEQINDMFEKYANYI